MQKINDIITKTVNGLGYELVEIEHTPSKLIRVFVDNVQGITIDDCEKISKQLNNVFFVETIDYSRLEVSSPGIERPLNNFSDFTRFNGKLAKVKTHNLVNGEKTFEGYIQGVKEDLVLIELSTTKHVVEIEYVNIKRARLIFDYKRDKVIKSK